MGKLSREQLEAKLAKQIPHAAIVTGHDVASDYAGAIAEADFHLPAFSTLRTQWNKYGNIGPAPTSADAQKMSPPPSPPSSAPADSLRDLGDYFFQVQSKGGTGDVRSAAGPKTMILDDDGNIIGAQG